MDRKNLCKLILITLASVLCMQIHAQNLVPNPSFEEHDGCPNNGNNWTVSSWFKITGGTYFHECGSSGHGIPISIGGGGYARTGQAYAGAGFWANSPMNESQMIGVEMAETLSAGLAYNVEMFVSLMDSSWYAIKNMGVHFSEDIPPQEIDSLLNLVPQVRYNETVFLDDKERWMRVSASFVASGGERYLTIGNFDGHDNTETLFVGGGVPPVGQPDYYKISAYFIDDVSIVPDSITAIGEVVGEERSYKLYPNPNTGEFTLSIAMGDYDIANIEVLSISGQSVHAQKVGNGSNRVNLNVAAGLYLYRVIINGTTQWTGKISVSSH
jgi:hypothetical protein